MPGGAWGDAQKYIEAGHRGGNGSRAYKTGVAWSTAEAPLIDTSVSSLIILIKQMGISSVVVSGLIVRYWLIAVALLQCCHRGNSIKFFPCFVARCPFCAEYRWNY